MSLPVALVTASGQGLGRAIAEHLATRYFVVGSYRSSAESAEALERAHPGRLKMLEADLSEPEARARLVEAARKEGDLAVLVNCLGVYPEDYIEDIDLGTFESVLTLTCTVCFDMIRLASPHMRAGGRIVNVGDSGADRIESRPQATPYHIAKLGVHVLTRTYAERLGPKGVTVNMVSPGFLDGSVGETPEIPLGGPTPFVDMLPAIDHLLSDAARSTSGTNLLVNGAWNL